MLSPLVTSQYVGDIKWRLETSRLEIRDWMVHKFFHQTVAHTTTKKTGNRYKLIDIIYHQTLQEYKYTLPPSARPYTIVFLIHSNPCRLFQLVVDCIWNNDRMRNFGIKYVYLQNNRRGSQEIPLGGKTWALCKWYYGTVISMSLWAHQSFKQSKWDKPLRVWFSPHLVQWNHRNWSWTMEQTHLVCCSLNWGEKR